MWLWKGLQNIQKRKKVNQDLQMCYRMYHQTPGELGKRLHSNSHMTCTLGQKLLSLIHHLGHKTWPYSLGNQMVIRANEDSFQCPELSDERKKICWPSGFENGLSFNSEQVYQAQECTFPSNWFLNHQSVVVVLVVVVLLQLSLLFRDVLQPLQPSLWLRGSSSEPEKLDPTAYETTV